MSSCPYAKSSLLSMITVVLLLVGCQVDDLGSSVGDAGLPIDCLQDAGRKTGCLQDQNSACEALKDYPDCIDNDGDCAPSGCDSVEGESIFAHVMDCNDNNPNTYPWQTELCDGIDNDCDSKVDETFDLGTECEQCGGGQLECSVTDRTKAVCNTLFGQSAHRNETDEVCDGADNDCDEKVDEHCALVISAEDTLHSPTLCGSQVQFVENNSLKSITLGSTMESATLIFDPKASVDGVPSMSDNRLRYAACSDTAQVWLMVDGECSTARGPLLCDAVVWIRHLDKVPRAVTALAQVGPPVVIGDSVYWHTQVGNRIDINRIGLTESTPVTVAQNMSDPRASAQPNRLFVRRWEEDRSRIIVFDVTAKTESEISHPPGGVTGVPVANDGWISWTTDRAQTRLWAVPVDNLRAGGFQVTQRENRISRIRLSGDVLVFSEESDTSRIMGISLRSGRLTTLVSQGVQDNNFDVNESQTVWVESPGFSVAHSDKSGSILRMDARVTDGSESRDR